jgi:hypothetical protein
MFTFTFTRLAGNFTNNFNSHPGATVDCLLTD